MKVRVVTVILICHWPLRSIFGCEQPLRKLPAGQPHNQHFQYCTTAPVQINTTNPHASPHTPKW